MVSWGVVVIISILSIMSPFVCITLWHSRYHRGDGVGTAIMGMDVGWVRLEMLISATNTDI